MTYRKNCNYSGECQSNKFYNATVSQKLKICNDCPGCGCCMFCGENLIKTEDFPLFKYNSVNRTEKKQNDNSFDLEEEIRKIESKYDREVALHGLKLQTGMIGNIPKISTTSYFPPLNI